MVRETLLLSLVVLAAHNSCAGEHMRQSHARIIAGAGYEIPKATTIVVAKIRTVKWQEQAHQTGKTGKAVFVVQRAIRGGKVGEEILLPVQELGYPAFVNQGNYLWQDLQFTEGSLFLILAGKDGLVDIAPVRNKDAELANDVEKAVEIDSKKPEDKLKALQDVLGEKSLKPVLLVNYGIEAAGGLVRTHPQACAILLSVATEATNPAPIRAAALDSISRNLADGRQKDERPTWAEEVKMLLEAAPKMKDSPLELLNQYSTVLSQAIHMGSWEKAVVIPSDVKIESPEKVKDGLGSVASRLDKSILDLKEKLTAAKSPATTFPAERQREQRIAELQAAITQTEERSQFLKELAKSVALHPASTRPGGEQ